MERWQRLTLVMVGAVIGAALGPAAATVVIDTDTVSHTGDVSLQTNQGLTVTEKTDQKVYEQPFVDDDTVALTNGIYAHSNGTASATITRADETWTNVTGMDVSSAYIRLNGTGTEHVQVSGGTDNISVGNVDYSTSADGEPDIRYAGASGNTTITLYNQSVGLGYHVVDLDTGDVVAQGQPDDNTISFTLSNSNHTIDLRQGAGDPYVVAASPIGNSYDKDRQVTLNATVEDPDGSDVQVEFFARQQGGTFTKVATKTVSNGSSATTSYTADPGTNEWKVRMNATNDGASANSSIFRFRTPGFVSVYNASTDVPTDSLQLLKKNVTLDIQSADSDFARQDNATDGVLNLSGVPDERLRLTLSRDGWANRTLVVEDPAQNFTTHMVPHPDGSLPHRNRTFVQRYELNDKTGQFPAEDTRLVVQDYFNDSWRTVSIRAFGGENIAPPVVQHSEEYRLRVKEGGDIRDLGVSEADDQYETDILLLTVEGVENTYGNVSQLGYDWNATYTNPSNDDPYLFFGFDTDNETVAKDFQLKVYEQGNESNVLFENDYGLVNTLEGTLPLTDSQAEKTWVIEWSATIDDESKSGQRVVGPSRAAITVQLDQFWKKTFSLGMLLVVAAFFGGVRSELGAIVVPAAAGVFWYLGWLPAYLGGGAIVLGLALGIMFRARATSGGVPT